MADTAQAKEYYTALKQWAVLILEGLAGKDTAAEVEKIEQWLLKLVPPQSYSGPRGAEVEMIKAHERSCAIMRQHQSKDPKTMTVLEFYETLESFKDVGKKTQQLNGEPYQSQRPLPG